MSWRTCVFAALYGALLVAWSAGPVFAQGRARKPRSNWSADLKVKAGIEYDSNAGRLAEIEENTAMAGVTCQAEASNCGVVDDGLFRLLVDLSPLRWRVARRHQLSLNYAGGAKIFFHEGAENTIANRLGLSWAWLAAPGVNLGIDTMLKQRWVQVEDRDYIYLRAGVRAGIRLPGRVLISPSVATHRFRQFRSRVYDRTGIGGNLNLRWQALKWLSFATAYAPGARFYDEDLDEIRHQVSATVGFRYKLLARTTYRVIVSDLEGQGFDRRFIRHRVELTVTVPLWWGMLLDLDTAIELSDEDFIRSPFDSPDQDEDWSKVVATLKIPVWKKSVSLELMGAFYGNRLGRPADTQGDYRRYTVFVGPSWRL